MLAVLAFGTAPVPAAPAQNGPYYATPSWDQTLPGSTRFTVLSNFGSAAVLDRETGLVWELTPSGSGDTGTWVTAINQCIFSNTGGRLGWRLPSAPELYSLIDPTQTQTNLLPAGNPFLSVTNGIFWTATTVAEDPTRAFIVGFSAPSQANPFSGPGEMEKAESLGETWWCVRGGSGAQSPQ
jgi:hypothetical protein